MKGGTDDCRQDQSLNIINIFPRYLGITDKQGSFILDFTCRIGQSETFELLSRRIDDISLESNVSLNESKKTHFNFLNQHNVFKLKPFELIKLNKLLQNYRNVNLLLPSSNCNYTNMQISDKICIESLYVEDKIYVFCKNNIKDEDINIFPLLEIPNTLQSTDQKFIFQKKYIKYKKKYYQLKNNIL